MALAAAGLCAVLGLSVAACLVELPTEDPLLVASEGGGLDAAVGRPVCGDGIIQRDAGEVCDPGDAGASSPTASSCAPGCTSIACPDGGFKGSNDHCYFTLGAAHIPMASATSGCAAQGAHPVTFDQAEEETFVDDMFGDAGGAYWMALAEDTSSKAPVVYDVGSVNEPGWRSTCSGCYGPTLGANATSFLNLCRADLVVGACVLHGPSDKAFIGSTCDGACGDAGAFVHAVCEREPAGLTGQGCDDGGVCMSLAGLPSTYELVLTALTRPDAAKACAAKRGPANQVGHLVIFQSADERAQLSRELSGRTQAGLPELSYWVGLENMSTTGPDDWTWDDGTPVSAFESEWADGEPTAGYTFAYGLVANSSAASSFDRQLIKTQTNDETTRFFVCEFDGSNG